MAQKNTKYTSKDPNHNGFYNYSTEENEISTRSRSIEVCLS